MDVDGEVFHGRVVGTKTADVISNQFSSAVIAFPGRATDIYMDKINADLSRWIIIFYFAGAVIYLVREVLRHASLKSSTVSKA